MIKFKLLSLFLLAFSVNLFGYNIDILEETKTHFTFKITTTTPPVLQKETPAISTLKLSKARYELQDTLNIPYYLLKIALPDTSKPSVDLQNIQYKQSNAIDFNALQKTDLVSVASIGYAGETPTLSLRMNPVKFSPKGIQYLTSATIRINYAREFTKTIKLSGTAKPSYLNQYSASQFDQVSYRLQKTAVPSFPTGQWFRIKISDVSAIEFNNESQTRNIFKIDFSTLTENGLTISDINKNRLFLYANSTVGKELTEYKAHGLVEIPRNFSDSDDTFSDGDILYFFGNSPSGLYLKSNNTLAFYRNPYSFDNYYWLLVADEPGEPQSIQMSTSNNSTADITTRTTDYLYRKEREVFNVLKSGNKWYNQKFDDVGSKVYLNFLLPSDFEEQTGKLRLSLKSGSESSPSNPVTQYYQINFNNQNLTNTSTADYSTRNVHRSVTFTPLNNTVKIEFYSGNGIGYLDYVQCEYSAKLSAVNHLSFFAPKQTGNIEYILKENFQDTPLLFDVSNPKAITQISFSDQEDSLTFRDYNSETNRKSYLLTSMANFSTPDEIKKINAPNFSDLYAEKNAEYLIITDEKFKPAAERIASLHSSKVQESDQLSTFITTQTEIMQAFHGGQKDPVAIRNFLKYAFHNWTTAPEYVLLLGDGTYDHRNIEGNTENNIMTFQVRYSSAGYDYYSTDFRYTYLTDYDKYPDVAIGRIPASDLTDALNYVEKLEDYLLNPTYGEWRHTISLVADDPEDPETNETYFTEDSEELTNSVLPYNFSVQKLYLLGFPDVQDDSKYGRTKPAATQAILDQLQKGTTIINYMGHGAPNKWSQEKAFTDKQLPEISNSGKLPFWIAGTCTWGKFDEINTDCMPEKLMNMDQNGGIAALGATRPTYGGPNFSFLKILFNYWFPGHNINRYRVGNVLKNNLYGNDRNDEKYIFFGDPALYLALPYAKGIFNELARDTLQALDNVTVSGKSELDNFSGNAVITLQDAQRSVTKYFVNNYDVKRSFTYKLPGDLLFKGNIKVENGKFDASFFIPKDLNYSPEKGKLHIYGWNPEEQAEFSGFYDDFVFSGSAEVTDTTGPNISMIKNGTEFYTGGLINSTDQFALKITDEHGINLTGKMGHNISLNLDDDIIDLTPEFAYEENSDTSGMSVIPLTQLEKGEHWFTVTAWDNANNSSSFSGSFKYTESSDFYISKVVNYPNPFSQTTDITFYASAPCDFSITIYSLNGLKIKSYPIQQSSLSGFNKIFWNGTDDFGDPVARGTYLYKIKAKSLDSGKKDSYVGKMVKS